MSNRMDRQGARTPADLERKYAFEKRMAEAMNAAEEAKKVATSISQTNDGLSLKVQALDNDLNGDNGVKAQLDLKVGTDADGNVTSKVHFAADTISIESDNFSLTEKGEIAARKGTLGGWVIDEFGIHQAHGKKGTYTITYTTTGTNIRTETHEGYLFYCLEANGIYRYIFEEDSFYPYDPTSTTEIQDSLFLWIGDMFGNYTITATYDTSAEL